eukprot:CAMPEP_0119015074 /NCGR_PEP_ID=MMETSP1176-20130426/10543_1 /TAXON_ID=265551 /ORGANISM="Synedropsis recta cf, Strain CCMP1620" /LENGTH=161 /DNA_ID=CAMNT_0006968337 /DNA_START=63 /DNA_END=548 /DNA_ORIENTATION=+
MSATSMNWLRRTLRPQMLQRVSAARTAAAPAKRNFGAPGGYPGGTPQSMKAELWGGHPKHKEGWEMDLYLTYGAAFGLIVMALGFAPDTSIQAWAQGEAQARLDLKAQGFDKFEFGTHYNTTSSNEAEWEKFNDKAIKPGEDDDDDDDDEDEDEEEDDDEE